MEINFGVGGKTSTPYFLVNLAYQNIIINNYRKEMIALKEKQKIPMEFSKKLLIADYMILFCLIIISIVLSNRCDLSTIVVAWIAQLGISSTAYYWKAKAENRTKIPFKVVEGLPEDLRSQLDLTEIIVSIIGSN